MFELVNAYPVFESRARIYTDISYNDSSDQWTSRTQVHTYKEALKRAQTWYTNWNEYIVDDIETITISCPYIVFEFKVKKGA